MTWKVPQATAYGGVLLNAEGQVLLREPTNHFDGYVWTFAKGRPELGDEPEQTALREVREETGYTGCAAWSIRGRYNDQRVFHHGAGW